MAANQNLVEQITLSVESTKDVQFSADEAQIINAVSPKVNIRRMEDGAVITVTDVDGVHDPVTVYDGAKGEKGDAGGVQYDSAQTLNATQKQTARTNISAASEEDVTDLKSAIEHKAEIDGYYQDMTVGDAEQLVSSQMVEDSVPYLFRKSGGSKDIGNRAYLDKIVGGTVAWNQLALLTNGTSTKNGMTIVNDSAKGTVTINGTATNRTIVASPVSSEPVNIGDVILATGCPTNGGWSTYHMIEAYGAFIDLGFGAIGKMTRTALIAQIIVYEGVECNNLVFRPQYFNLTQMFGQTIADAVYAMERASAGAGIAWFRKLFPADYYAYNTGELMSVSGLSEHKTVGFNLWDEEWEKGYYASGQKVASTNSICCKNLIPVIPGEQYFVQYPGGFNLYYSYFESNKNSVVITGMDSSRRFVITNASLITIPKEVHYLAFSLGAAYGTTYKNDICINLSDPSRNGTYEPYEEHSYSLDSSLTLRGIPKLDAENNLYYNGDEYTPDGKVNRRYGIVDLGTLNWSKMEVESPASWYFYAALASPKVFSVRTQPFVCREYTNIADGRTYANVPDKSIYNSIVNNSTYCVCIIDSAYTDPAAFKTAMSGVYLVYELATPTEETAEPYHETQIVDALGTEEFVSTSIMPVGHLTEYPANLRDKLEHLPDLASVDGAYMIHQQSGQMSLTPHPIPLAPSTDGTYTLKATVSNGTATYTWEAVT